MCKGTYTHITTLYCYLPTGFRNYEEKMSTADINLRTVLILFFAESSEKSEKRPEKRRKSEENRGQDYLEDDYCMGVFSQ